MDGFENVSDKRGWEKLEKKNRCLDIASQPTSHYLFWLSQLWHIARGTSGHEKTRFRGVDKRDSLRPSRDCLAFGRDCLKFFRDLPGFPFVILFHFS